MREEVIIVLNERESRKSSLAENLEQKLAEQKICSVRIAPEQNLSKLILKREPLILVLDFLLGEFGTALDLMENLRSEKRSCYISTIVWTDEPSISSAVKAIQKGASDYIEMDNPNGLERVVSKISEILSKQKVPLQREHLSNSTPFIKHSRAYRQCLTKAELLAQQNHKAITVLGETGSGRSTIGKFLHKKREKPSVFEHIDLDTFPSSITEFLYEEQKINAQSSGNTTLMIDHIEFYPTKLLDYLQSQPKTENQSNQLLILGTNCEKVARATHKLLSCPILEIPSLKERKEGFSQLIRAFQKLSSNLQNPTTNLDSELVTYLSELDWPGNIKQLKASIVEILSAPVISSQEDDLEPLLELSNAPSSIRKADLDILRSIIKTRKKWANYNSRKPYVPSKIETAKTLEATGGDYRIAAAMLGTGIPQLRKSISDSTNIEMEIK